MHKQSLWLDFLESLVILVSNDRLTPESSPFIREASLLSDKLQSHLFQDTFGILG